MTEMHESALVPGPNHFNPYSRMDPDERLELVIQTMAGMMASPGPRAALGRDDATRRTKHRRR